MLRVRAAGERRPSIVGLDRSWPPKDFPLSTTDPVNGFEVPPERTRAGRAGVELLFEVVADRPGHYAARGLEIAYEDAGGKRYRDVMPDALGVCALPRGRDPETAPQCPFVGTLPEGKVG